MKTLNSIFITVTSFIFLTVGLNVQQSVKYYSCCNLQAKDNTHSYYSPPPSLMKESKTSQFEITFVNATEEMKTAVQYAADIWSSILISDVPIKVLVTFYPMPSFLGQCVPNMVKNFTGAPLQDVWYISSLADAITGVDQNPGEYDMDIFLSSQVPWYYGVDGQPGEDKFDLVCVALHEMGHGLGYLSLGNVDDQSGSYGQLTENDLTRPIVFPFPDLENLPSIYDKYLVNSENNFITDTTYYLNPSPELRSLFTGNNMYFYGEKANEANGSTPVKVYAESPFIFASSILHLDEDSYPPESTNSLMTPYVDYGEANHNPGPVTIGLLQDLGWTINDSITVSVKGENEKLPNSFALLQNYPNPFNPTTSIEYQVPKHEMVMLKVYDILGNEIVTLVNEQKSPGIHKVKFNADNLTSGVYIYRLQTASGFNAIRKLILLK